MNKKDIIKEIKKCMKEQRVYFYIECKLLERKLPYFKKDELKTILNEELK